MIALAWYACFCVTAYLLSLAMVTVALGNVRQAARKTWTVAVGVVGAWAIVAVLFAVVVTRGK